jgi:hypothetical protein
MNAHAERGGRLLLLNSLPGVLAGAHFASLLFFLNPELPFEWGPWLRAALRYSGLLALASFLFLGAFTRGRGRRARRFLPWAITLVLAFVGATDWILASRFAYYLPPGINARLIKAAVWLTLATLVFFYTALLHTLHRRPYGWRSRIGLTLLALGTVYIMAERREAFKPRPSPAPLPSVVELGQRPTLYVVGLDGASLDAVLPLARQGRLPFFSRLLEEGVYARPQSFSPVHRTSLWTTLATGRLPFQHGIISERVHGADFLTKGAAVQLLPTPFDHAVWSAFEASRPVDAEFLSVLTHWNILETLGLTTGIIGWPGTYPVPRSRAFAFSERYFTGDFRPTCAQPSELAERGVLFQVDDVEVDPVVLEELGTRVPFSLLQALSKDLWRESLTRFLLEQRRETQAMFLVLPGLSEVSQRYLGGFAAVHFSGVQRKAPQEAAQILSFYYSHLDQFLADLWQRETRPKLLAVVSSYGFEAPEGWRRFWALITGRSLQGFSQQAPDGLLLLAGEGLQTGKFLEDARLVDILPTLLYAQGFPIARDLEGRVLTDAFKNSFLARNPLTFVPSYETLVARPGVLSFSRPLSE